ncbi:type II toxin-antitoxin system VapC family toxin [Synechococcus sp. EJ6-Ellesmere]|uniref:type II toxin-antitoxin system VapC family toxin n=1 Tax=Synechococcus sp. EJ6-Ellesmere TaxID=2823734 RepID=UPI0020CED000|nr:type II toxin-antitoxin system VapC family toxin [Synechococcus sp. EJ6-Ellesmere]
MILLDTNVISELMRPQPEPGVLAWADALDPEGVAITAMNEAEILHGLARLPDGRRKQQLQQSWDSLAAELFTGRVWPFTSEAAHWYGELLWRRERLARPMATADARSRPRRWTGGFHWPPETSPTSPISAWS